MRCAQRRRQRFTWYTFLLCIICCTIFPASHDTTIRWVNIYCATRVNVDSILVISLVACKIRTIISCRRTNIRLTFLWWQNKRGPIESVSSIRFRMCWVVSTHTCSLNGTNGVCTHKINNFIASVSTRGRIWFKCCSRYRVVIFGI